MDSVPTRASLDAARSVAAATRGQMIELQEELDWRCYRLYGLHEASAEHAAPPPLRLGERAFEIVMARQIAAGELETTWFERHGSTPITSLPSHWPDDYRRVVEQRIALIETDANIGMIERPEFKRRWSTDPWEEMERAALRAWLLDRMEAPSIWTSSDARLLSTNQLTDTSAARPRLPSPLSLTARLWLGRRWTWGSMLATSTASYRSARHHPSLAFSSGWGGAVAGLALFATFYSWRQVSPNCFWLWVSLVFGERGTLNAWSLRPSPPISMRSR
jgi:hypothetical protein